MTTNIPNNIVWQLYSMSEGSPDLLPKANDVLRKALNGKGLSNEKGETQIGFQSTSLDFRGAYEGLMKVYGGQFFLVIDALDECKDRDTSGFLNILREVAQSKDVNLKILLVSRPETDISKTLSGCLRIKVEGKNEEDMRRAYK